MGLWGDPVVIWSEAVVELWRWRRQRRELERQAALLVAETEVFLAAMTDEPR